MVFTAKDCLDGAHCVGFVDETVGLDGFFTYRVIRDPIDPLTGAGPGSGLVRRSRDGRHIAYSQAHQLLLVSELSVKLESGGTVSYEADTLSSVDIGLQSGSPYDWLPDGGLIYTQDTGQLSDRISLARTLSATTDVASSIPISDYFGEIRQIDVSPDGNYAMLRFIESLTEIPLVIDLRTNEIFEPVSREQNPFLDIGLAIWSPDSQWILFRVNSASNLDALVPSVPIDAPSTVLDPVYAMRIDGQSRPLPRTVNESGEGARIVLARPSDDPDGALGPQNATFGVQWVE